ncbi:hypothetical protein [Nocardioides taihuensis]|uniref:Uncharacterized protein n=1 Tax=Nocardioides taihuensis TaxID=1835606 RepID=A0ABW0BIK5_9ACTN
MRSDKWKRSAGPAVVLLLLSAVLAGCGGSDTPAVCSSVDDLKSDIAAVKDIDLSADGVSQLQTALETVKTDLEQVQADASAEFSDEVDAVTTDLSTVESDFAAAKETPNATTLGALGTSVQALLTDVTTLVDDVEGTC